MTASRAAMGKSDTMEAAKPALDARLVRSRAALNAALLGLLAEKPFDQITIREITARAKTGYATFFRHYSAKEALLSDIASAEISELFAMTIPIMFDSNSHESTLALCSYVAARRKLWAALLTGGASGTVREEFIRQAREWAAQAPRLTGWLPADLAVVYGSGGTIDVLAWWLGRGDDMSVEQIAGTLNRLVIAPLVGDRAHMPENS
jgi:AcrR family transcriptional regulator